jgi:hypothetical protein
MSFTRHWRIDAATPEGAIFSSNDGLAISDLAIGRFLVIPKKGQDDELIVTDSPIDLAKKMFPHGYRPNNR